ncbi:heterokaryon incompatibility protein-domain-containing protein [Microdochium bolleyi]|uniref:Heterokaryon incompatibility protein-domain-containing protein n=1 Tax=Microdochium bolleyi TaxID=196109 RepID=A0A136JEF0_9PEZI|nr:heterokaryon incompatibility protein-domain-containing protein [Microdochium bolleyi]
MQECPSYPDTLEPLAQIRSRSGQPLVHTLLAIARDAGPVDSWIDNFECLYLGDDSDDNSRDADFVTPSKRRRGRYGPLRSSPPSPKLLRRRNLDPLSGTDSSRDYVAVSYTWDASQDEDPATGGYSVETRERQGFRESSVRDNVWRRVLRFAKHVGCPHVWVDRECINQEDEIEKQAAMQSMHLVYSLSRCPVALLTCNISSKTQLVLLGNLMKGKVTEETQADTLELIQYIISSPWWSRAWTFQEDYRASSRIKLLIPHVAELEDCKRKVSSTKGALLFGAIAGEVTLKSVDFKRQATRFCISYQKQHGLDPSCRRVIETAGRYTELLKEKTVLPGMPSITRSMSPTIFADVVKRGIAVESDRLAIIANCCGYDTRLKTGTSSMSAAGESSLSLSMMALFLLNGEIMENDPARAFGSLRDSILAYISKQSLRNFRPVSHRELTFIKRCRFPQPRLTAHGIVTQGHLWALGDTIRREAVTDSDMTASQILQALSVDLLDGTFGEEYTDLAEHIEEWIGSSQATNTSFSSQHPSSQWRDWMALQIAECLREGLPLRLGTLVRADDDNDIVRKEHRKQQPTAIFVTEDEPGGNADDRGPAEHVFTSYRWARSGTDDLDKHVSLQVRLVNQKRSVTNSGVGSQDGAEHEKSQTVAPTNLYIDRWVNGLCFFAGHAKQEVLFPLPSALTE